MCYYSVREVWVDFIVVELVLMVRVRYVSGLCVVMMIGLLELGFGCEGDDVRVM